MDNRIVTAPGAKVFANGRNFHVRHFGQSGPQLVLECGMTMMSACWGWLAPELAGFARVMAYDRAGMGWSDERESPREAKSIAQELVALLSAAGVSGPYVLVGHSMGAIFNRALLRQSPEAVAGLVWLDPAHPEQMKARGIRRRIRNLVFYIEAAQLLASRNIPAIELPLVRHLHGLPADEFRTLKHCFRNGRHLRTAAREARAWELSSAYIRDEPATRLPMLQISACRNSLPGWSELQKDLSRFSTDCTHLIFPEMSHISMIGNRAHALRISAEIHGFLTKISI